MKTSKLFGALVLVLTFLFSANVAFASTAVSANETREEVIKKLADGDGGILLEKMNDAKVMKRGNRIAKFLGKHAKGLAGAGSDDGKLVAVLSYLFFVGFIIALVLHMTDKKTSLGGYHLAQVLGLIIMSAFGFILGLIPIIGLLALVVYILVLINWLFGLINAVKGEEKPMPIFGKLFDKSFRSLFE